MNDYVFCACCQKGHFGQQNWNDDFQDYVCLACEKDLSMKVKIQIEEKDNDFIVFIMNSDHKDFVSIRIIDSEDENDYVTAEVRIDDLKTALRKIAVK